MEREKKLQASDSDIIHCPLKNQNPSKYLIKMFFSITIYFYLKMRVPETLKKHESRVLSMFSEKSFLLTISLFLIFILSPVPPAHAAEPLWTYSSTGDEIGGVTISSDGSAIAVAGGKIWLFSKNGTLLVKEPYGDKVIFTPDGSYLISSYSDSLYKFKRIKTSGESESPLQKMWDRSHSGTIRSIDVTDNGNTIVAALEHGGTYVYDSNGKMVGGNKGTTAIIRISSRGEQIVGVSQGVLCLYRRNAVCSKSEEGIVRGIPDFMEITSSGDIAVFSDGPRVRSVYLENKTLRWIQSAGGDVTALAMTPSGSGILAGTSNGNISLLDQHGNLSWSYASNPGNKQGSEITCSALSKEGTVAAAGSNDGKIFALNSTGEVIWSNQTKDHIHYIAMSADGSLIVATGDNTVYAFSTSRQPAPAVRTTVKSTTPVPSLSSIPQGNSSTQKPANLETTLREITAVPTEYSVIKTSTQSPLSDMLALAGVLVASFVALRKR
jgi:hypothetical protein